MITYADNLQSFLHSGQALWLHRHELSLHLNDPSRLWCMALTCKVSSKKKHRQSSISKVHTFWRYLALWYCPRQAPMGARSSSTKIWGWAVTRRRCLNGPTISAQAPTQDAKLTARGYQINLHCRFARASSRPAWWWKMLEKRTDS